MLVELRNRGETKISSSDIGKRIGVTSHSIRKDLSYLGEIGTIGSGYHVQRLKEEIEIKLGLNIERKACIVGLANISLAILNNKSFVTEGFSIVSGFDSNINRLETIKTDIPVYPTYEMQAVIKREQIELALLTLPGLADDSIVERLIDGGIRGIINFTPVVLSTKHGNVFIRNIDLIDEFRYLSALFYMDQ